MHIIHNTGIHNVKIVFCGCHNDALESTDDSLEYRQLLRHRLFPVTHAKPHTAVSFSCLNDFHLLTTQGKLTGQDYYETLLHLTDNAGIDPPRVRSHFPRSCRGTDEWCYRIGTPNSCALYDYGGTLRC